MSNRNILIIEDDKYIVNFIGMSLSQEGYNYKTTALGKDALRLISEQMPDIILLDLGLPDIDGIEIIKSVRLISKTVPILVVSARLEEQQRIQALDLGANDYIVKPFYMGELLARIRVAERLITNEVKENMTYFSCDFLSVDFQSHKVLKNQEEIHLTPIEFNLLELLIEHRGTVLTHNFIMNQIWGYVDKSNQNALRVFMATLRKKIEMDTNHPRFIQTEIGIGYRFNID